MGLSGGRERSPDREQALLEHIEELTSDAVHAMALDVGMDGGDRP